ncbi:MAG: 4-hydroxy-3-methylbut-2-enyl diphosphate reductase [Candidatus Aminicenantes bacterium]|nr:4-hydroxy-3-methylbut-2-enyl diphosphate reductase [Candidatus Aminicenantes bacterium]
MPRTPPRRTGIDVSPYAGFCGGVRRTIKTIEALKAARPAAKIYLLGKIVHNETVLARLKRRGFIAIDDYRKARDGILVIQSHGIPAALFAEVRRSGIEFADTTCPMVKDIHRRARELEADGCRVAIIGDRGHEEVLGIAGQVHEPLIVGRPEDVDSSAFKAIPKVGVVVQSTFIRENAERIVRKIRRFVPDVRFENTICKPTTDRQLDARAKAGLYANPLVIGSNSSANTRNLLSIMQSKNPKTRLISRPEDVDEISFGRRPSVYVVSGASTPQDVIDRTVRRLRRLSRQSAGRKAG